MEPPRLKTARLTLDGHRREDLEEVYALWADPEVVRLIGGKTFTRQESWSRLLRYRGLWPVVGYGPWVVRERESNRFVGEVGFADFKRDLDPAIVAYPEANWVMATWAQGRGFASEALAAALDWLQAQGSHAQTFCLMHPENGASIRVAEKNGFQASGSVLLAGAATNLMTRGLALPT